MKELLRHIQRYGPGWTIMLRVGKNNNISMVLQFLSEDKLYHEELMFTDRMIDRMRDKDPVLLNSLDTLRLRILKKRR